MPKVLLLRFSSIGDIVLTSPIIRCLKAQVNDIEIHFLTKQSFASILTTNPDVTKVFTIQKKVAEVLSLLKKENYDYIIDLHHNFRTKQVIWSLQKPSKSFPKLNFKKWLLVQLKINQMPVVHIVDRYFKAAAHFSVFNDLKGLDFFIPGKDEVKLHELPENLSKGFIALVIGAQHFTKRMPNDKIIDLCSKLPLPVVLIGGKEDVTNANLIEQALGNKVHNACGKYNLFQSASIIRQSSLVISHDTGMMHIAAAFNKKIISVWGNTVPEFGMYPYMPAHIENSFVAEVKNLSCRPCSKIGKTSCPKGHFKCMNDLNTNVILEQALAFTS
jgi:ADP-heptose:LPS heptosyltransferase